jgi:cold shock protein
MNGTVKFFNQGKGFGFITAEDDKEYFVHISGINDNAVLKDNDSVTFDVEQGDRGPKAVNVSLAGQENF